jgi:hypothetical protein
MIIIFVDFRQFCGGKMAGFFLKIKIVFQFLRELLVIYAKNPIFFAKFYDKKY